MPWELKDWQEIHPDFTAELRQAWIKWFGWRTDEKWAYQSAQDWIRVGLTPSEVQLARWLDNKDYVPNEQARWGDKITFNPDQKAQLQAQYLADEWAQLHPDFAAKNWDSKTYQQRWVKAGCSKTEARAWLASGFTPRDYQEVENWKAHAFTSQQTQAWLKMGLTKDEVELATYLKAKNRQLNSNLNLESLKAEFHTAQNWLDFWYPVAGTCLRKNEYYNINNYGQTRGQITKLSIIQKDLTGELDLTTFVNLEKLDYAYNRLTSLVLPTPNKLKEIRAHDKLLTTFDYSVLNPATLTGLNLGYNDSLDNNLTEFSHLVNLEQLYLKNTQIKGSLESLKQMSKLEALNISNTDINAGVEYLPSSIRYLKYTTDLRPDCQLKAIVKELDQFKNNRKAYLKSKIKAKQLEQQPILAAIEAVIKPYQEKLKPLEEQEKFLINNFNIFTENYVPKLKKLLGQGGFASVYSGTWKGQSVAVKKSLYNLTNQQEIDSVKQEVELLKQLRNKYIIQYYDFYQAGSEFMIILELAEQGTLTKYIENHKDQKYDWQTNYNFIKHMTLGLTYLHSSNIIHRDLKSMNILICEGNIAKIADFGISKVINELATHRTTSKGTGTIAWMDPYYYQAQTHSFASDIYSLGMVLWEICAQRLPYAHIPQDFIICQILAGHKEEIPADTPPVLQTIITECWQDNPQQRIRLSQIETKINEELVALIEQS